MDIKNYKKTFEINYGEKTPKEDVIHHLDHNRNNNNILNLVRVNRKIHDEFHRLYDSLKEKGLLSYSLDLQIKLITNTALDDTIKFHVLSKEILELYKCQQFYIKTKGLK